MALGEGDLARAEREIAEALALIEGRIAPLTGWRTYETAAEVYKQTGRSDHAKHYRELRNETLQSLADSLAEDEPLRESILAAISRPALQLPVAQAGSVHG